MATLEQMGAKTNRFIKRQQEQGIVDRNVPIDLAPKIKLNPKTAALKKKKRKIPTTLRG